MNRSIKTAAALVGGFVLLSFGVVVVNQTAGVVSLAGEVHPALGKVTLVVLIGSFAAMVGVPVVMYVRLPRSLDPPPNEDDPAFAPHLEELRARVASNPIVTVPPAELAGREGLERAIAQLDARADEIVRSTASVVFLSTAVSQNGQFDAMIVLAAQSRMVWQIAHLYSQRPTARDMARLYANVAATAFAAGAIDEIDLNEQLQPILGSAIGSMAGVIPGFQTAANVLVHSVLSGTASAYLTLRVGLIAKRYCGALVLQPRPAIRRAASAEAAKMLGRIVAEGTGRISSAIWAAVREKGAQTVDGVKDRVVTSYDNLKGSVIARVASVSESARGAGDSLFRRFQRSTGQAGPEASA
ncbi:DUF697 domain-containing protein [Tautonia sociabilis]|uniref:DUF697 domain-containing protein n=1 Tax=Tautonia sociabilis TaxID=2080755 RepID=A0A432MGG2_9BACT|nr:DUF697 domain-containing protein [Tautonia sociabilis]RUL85610.1 DUF697 domain-containing protein [Tautonia sociabilis]